MKRTLRAQADFLPTILRNQLTSLVLFESISTTAAKGKKLIPYANHFFNRVKSADLIAKKIVHQTLLDKNAIKKVFEEVLPRYEPNETTYVKLLRAMPRHGDSAAMVRLSLIKTLNVEESKVSKAKPVDDNEPKKVKKTAKTKKVAKK